MCLVYALRFLTILPIPWREGEDLSKVAGSVMCFPPVGWIIGVVLTGIGFFVLTFWSPLSTAVLVVTAWVLLTGGLHLDGLSDLADGLGGGRDAGRRLEIMRDSRIGTFGALALILLLALKTAMVYELLSETGAPDVGTSALWAGGTGLDGVRHTIFSGSLPASWTVSATMPVAAWIVIAPVLGRFVMVALIVVYPTARPDGLGIFFKERIRVREIAATAVLTLGICALSGGVWGLFAVVGASLFALLAALPVSRALGGLTGDAYGGICEVTESALLIAGTIVAGSVSIGF